jgi:hypothetical protein
MLGPPLACGVSWLASGRNACAALRADASFASVSNSSLAPAFSLDPLEDLNMEDALNFPDLAADGRLRQMHSLGGGGEAARLCDRDNVGQVTELEMIVDAHAVLGL